MRTEIMSSLRENTAWKVIARQKIKHGGQVAAVPNKSISG
jgi:hypothetical protein